MKKIIGILFLISITVLTLAPVIVFSAGGDSLSWNRELAGNIMGSLSWVTYLSAYIFAFVGMFLRWYFTTVKAVKCNTATPSKFILSYWLKDNLIHIIPGVGGSLALIFIALRFSVDLFGKPVSMLIAFGVGLFLDWVADTIKNLQPKLFKNITDVNNQ